MTSTYNVFYQSIWYTCICIKWIGILTLNVSLRSATKLSQRFQFVAGVGQGVGNTFRSPLAHGSCSLCALGPFSPRELHFPEGSSSGRPICPSAAGAFRQHHDRWVQRYSPYPPYFPNFIRRVGFCWYPLPALSQREGHLGVRMEREALGSSGLWPFVGSWFSSTLTLPDPSLWSILGVC